MESNEQKHKREYVPYFKDHIWAIFFKLVKAFKRNFWSVLTNAQKDLVTENPTLLAKNYDY
jgi:hypothetical protein